MHIGNRVWLSSVGLALLATGCTVVREPQLFPTNDIANATGVLHGKFVGHGQGHGTMEVAMPDGEKLEGEYSVVLQGAVGFGNVFASVYGPGGTVSGSGMSSSMMVSGSGQGMALISGNRGTSMQCEFMNSNFTGHGYGGCKTSKGALYRMIY